MSLSLSQVHLICMPPSGDISCKKSSQYHFVNEYLYKPLNLAEAESKPNVTLRYSERYYPADIYTDERENEFQNSANRKPLNQVIKSETNNRHLQIYNFKFSNKNFY